MKLVAQFFKGVKMKNSKSNLIKNTLLLVILYVGTNMASGTTFSHVDNLTNQEKNLTKYVLLYDDCLTFQEAGDSSFIWKKTSCKKQIEKITWINTPISNMSESYFSIVPNVISIVNYLPESSACYLAIPIDKNKKCALDFKNLQNKESQINIKRIEIESYFSGKRGNK